MADEILSTRGLRTPFIRVAKDGAIIDAARFTGPGGVGATIADQVVDSRIMELFASGHTVVLQALHRLWPPLVEFAGALSEDLAHPVQINAYITPRQSQGFSAHYDVHDVFVVQIAGSKRWVIHDPVHPDPLPSQPWTRYRRDVEARAAEDPSADYVLEEGDVLYLPRGFIHSAEALGGVSAHLTIGIHSHTRHDLVRSLLELAEEDPRLRRSLPLGVDIADPTQLSSDLASTVTALADQLQVVSPSDVAAVMARRNRGNTRPAPLGPLAQAQALERLRCRHACLTQVSATGHDPGRRGAGGARASGRKPDVRRDGERGADGRCLPAIRFGSATSRGWRTTRASSSSSG